MASIAALGGRPAAESGGTSAAFTQAPLALGVSRPVGRMMEEPTMNARTCLRTAIRSSAAVAAAVALAVQGAPGVALADETCQSPYMQKIVGHEDFVYVWTLGEKGVADGQDSLVVVDVREGSPTLGRVTHRASVGSWNEAHHGGFTDDRTRLWLGGLDTSRIFIFDVAKDPAKPTLVKTLNDVPAVTGGLVGPHTFVALPGRMLVAFLSNTRGTGETGFAEFTNDGRFIRAVRMPKAAPYGYDLRVNVHLNRMLTSAFTGKSTYMVTLADVLKRPEPAKSFGHQMVVWNLHTRAPLQVLDVPGAPLEIRWALRPENRYAFTATALTHQIYLIHQKDDGTFAATAVGDLGDVLPVDISLSKDDRYLYVVGFMTGEVQQWDVSDPFRPKRLRSLKVGESANMISQSWDGRRLYVTNSLLSRWDKPGPFFMKRILVADDGNLSLDPDVSVDFGPIGRPHQMNFGSAALYGTRASGAKPR